MPTRPLRLALLTAAVVASVATSEPLPGDLGSPCTTDQDCNPGLECVDDTCEYEATPAVEVDCEGDDCAPATCIEHAWAESCAPEGALD